MYISKLRCNLSFKKVLFFPKSGLTHRLLNNNHRTFTKFPQMCFNLNVGTSMYQHAQCMLCDCVIGRYLIVSERT